MVKQKKVQVRAYIVIYPKSSMSIQWIKPTKKEIESAEEFNIKILPCIITYEISK